MSLPILNTFKNTLIEFLDVLIESHPQIGDFVLARIMLKDQIPIIEVMKYLMGSLLPHKEIIKARNDTFFLDMDLISFGGFNLHGLKDLWRSGKLDNDDKEIIWQWIDTIVILVEKYSKSC